MFALVAHRFELHNQPVVQAIMEIGQMVADAACEVKMDGMLITFSFWNQKQPEKRGASRETRRTLSSFLARNS